MRIKNWFLNKNFSQNERLVIEQDDYTIISETEKAIRVRFMSDYGNVTTWLPKSVVSYEKTKTTFKQEEIKEEIKIKTKTGEIKEVTWMDSLTVQTSDGKTYMKFAVEFI